MGSLGKQLAKRRKKELKAQLKLEKKRRKAGHVQTSAPAETAQASPAPPVPGPAAEGSEDKELEEQSIRIHRWRLWAAIAGVIISAVGVALRIYQLLSQ